MCITVMEIIIIIIIIIIISGQCIIIDLHN